MTPERPRAEKSRPERARADKARADKGRADKGRADKGRADKGRADKPARKWADKPRGDSSRPERERREPRLDTPAERHRRLVPRPAKNSDAFGVFAEQFARFMGTATFLIWMTIFVAVWVCWNLLAPNDLRFDNYPFIFLTLMLSLQASYAAPLILLAQNRQELRDRVIAEQDRQANSRAHADMEYLAREVASLRMALGEVATRDYLRSELRGLLQELDDRHSDESEASEIDPEPTDPKTDMTDPTQDR